MRRYVFCAVILALVMCMLAGCRVPRQFVEQWQSPQGYADNVVADPTDPNYFLWFEGYGSEPYGIERRSIMDNQTTHTWVSPTHERFQYLEHLSGDLYYASGDVPWVGLDFFGIIRLDPTSDVAEFENQVSFGHGEVFGPGTSDGENIYYYDFVSSHATVIARTAYTGELLWTSQLPTTTGTNLRLATGTGGELIGLVLSAYGGTLYRLDNTTGDILWSTDVGEAAGQSLSVKDVAMVAAYTGTPGETDVLAFNLTDGAPAFPVGYTIATPFLYQININQEANGWRTYVSYYDTAYQQHVDLLDFTATDVQVVGTYIQPDNGCSESVIDIVPVTGGMLFNGADCTGHPGVLRYYTEELVRTAAAAAAKK